MPIAFGNGSVSNSNEESHSAGGSIGGGSSSNQSSSWGGTLGTGASSSAFSHQMMQEANEFNARQAELNRKWQEYMSNTAYQRAMKDLRKAGLNPILAYTNGPASTGSGATASSAMGQAYTDNYSESHSSGHSSEYNKSWNKSDSWGSSEMTQNLANNISAVSGLAMQTIHDIVDTVAPQGSAESLWNKVKEGSKYIYNTYGLGRLIKEIKGE